MRRAVAVLAAAVLGTFAGSCRKPAEPPPDPNRLVLELGGQGERLADTLAKLRGATKPTPEPAPQVTPDPKPKPKPESKPEEAPPRHVRLEKGETIYALAQRELGASKRWKEILELNGWTEAKAAKLPPGTVVKIPAK